MCGRALRNLIADILDGLDERSAIDGSIRRDACLFGRQVDDRIGNAGDGLEGSFDTTDAGGAGHAFY